jgi:hypothetical protein
VFYGGSVFGRRPGGAGASEDRSVAPDKRARLPGQGATFDNVTSFTRGINGVMIDVGRPDGSGPLTSADFVFDVGRGEDPRAWRAAPAPLLVATRPGTGLNGADRVTVQWPAGAVRNEWLRVTVLAGLRTGVARDDVFYFGNLAGKTDVPDAATPVPAALTVSLSDLAGVRRRLFTKAWINSAFDFNRDGRINALDVATCRLNLRHTLPLFLAPIEPAAAAPRD